MKKLLERPNNTIIATARVPAEAQQLQQLAAQHSNLKVAALDVSSPESITAFAAAVKQQTQHVDVSRKAVKRFALVSSALFIQCCRQQKQPPLLSSTRPQLTLGVCLVLLLLFVLPTTPATQVLINNAGIYGRRGTLMDLQAEEFQQVTAVQAVGIRDEQLQQPLAYVCVRQWVT